MEMSPTKVYIDRGIQTDPPRNLSRRSDDAKAVNIHPTLPNGSAYTQSSPLCGPKRDNMLSQLPYQKPSAITQANKRVVSLPETSPPQRIKPLGDRERVASMSEQLKVMLASSADSTVSSDCFESSVSIDSSRSHSSAIDVSIGRRARPRRSLRSSLVLRTPSPPSSPESVMIIGNDMQVPSSIFRQKVETLPVPEEDDDGWITWASSPPRPIPALHGPLSLPYARCPSGAEGTIIEGEDMTRMIWGLGNDTTNRDYRREQEALSQLQNFSQEPQNLGVNLQQQQSPFSGMGTSLSSMKRTQTHVPQEIHSSNVVRRPNSNHRCEDDSVLQARRDNIYDGLPMSSAGNEAFYPGDSPTGLGILYQDLLESSENLHRNNPLKASAPIFVPTRQAIRSMDNSARSYAIASGRQIPAIDLAYEYQARHQALESLPTPPNSSCIGWSPSDTFSTPISVRAENPFNTLPCDDMSEELRRFIYERIGQQKLSPTDLKQISDIARSMERSVPPTPAIDRLYSSSLYSPAIIDISSSHAGLPNTPLPSVYSLRSRGDMIEKGSSRSSPFATSLPLSPVSPVFDTGSQTPQLRALPFTRLIQHKLSSVPEEEPQITSYNTNKPRRQVERTAFGGGAAQHYKPYFAHTPAQKVARVQDIDQNTKPHTSISSARTLDRGNRVSAPSYDIRQGIRSSIHPQLPMPSPAVKVKSVLLPENHTRVREGDVEAAKKQPSSISASLESPEVGLSTENKHNSTSADEGQPAGPLDVKSASRKKGKNKTKRQEIPSSKSQSLDSESSEPWLSGPALNAWLA